MLRRYHITLGATTTAGGKVSTASSLLSIDGARMALDGDTISCPACGADGIIETVGPRLPESFNGRPVALSEDLCRCKCSPPPTLVGIQTRRHQDVDETVAAYASQPGSGEMPRGAATGPGSARFDDKLAIRLLDPLNRQPFSYRHYRLELSGKVLEGMTDGDGCTQPLSAAERASLLAWHVDDIGAA
jgi:uncharacterized Zn-binding protein involved in type VI secretion